MGLGGHAPPLLPRGSAPRSLTRGGRGRGPGGATAGLAQAWFLPRPVAAVALAPGDHAQRVLPAVLTTRHDPRAAHRPPARAARALRRGRGVDADRRRARARGPLADRPSHG